VASAVSPVRAREDVTSAASSTDMSWTRWSTTSQEQEVDQVYAEAVPARRAKNSSSSDFPPPPPIPRAEEEVLVLLLTQELKKLFHCKAIPTCSSTAEQVHLPEDEESLHARPWPCRGKKQKRRTSGRPAPEQQEELEAAQDVAAKKRERKMEVLLEPLAR
ncbi:unnamed protein product, partial [Amoebophrya sp. A120]